MLYDNICRRCVFFRRFIVVCFVVYCCTLSDDLKEGGEKMLSLLDLKFKQQ